MSQVGGPSPPSTGGAIQSTPRAGAASLTASGAASGEPNGSLIRRRKTQLLAVIFVVLVAVIVGLRRERTPQMATVIASPARAFTLLRFSSTATERASMVGEMQDVQVTSARSSRPAPSILTIRIPVSSRLCPALARHLRGSCDGVAPRVFSAPDVALYSRAGFVLSESARVSGVMIAGPGLSNSVFAFRSGAATLTVVECTRANEILTVQAGSRERKVPCATAPQHSTLVIRGRYRSPPSVGADLAENLVFRLGPGVLSATASAARLSSGGEARQFAGQSGTTTIVSNQRGFAVSESPHAVTLASRAALSLVGPDGNELVPSAFESADWLLIALISVLLGGILGLGFELITERGSRLGGTAKSP